MKKNLIKVEKVKNLKNDGKGKMYIFYNLSKGQGIKRLRSFNSNIIPGELVKINGEIFILDGFFNPEEKTVSIYTGPRPSQEELYQFRLSFA